MLVLETLVNFMSLFCRLIQISSGEVYPSDKTPSIEESPSYPNWTDLGLYCHDAEERLESIQGLDYVIVRLAYVYGRHSSDLLRFFILGIVSKETSKVLRYFNSSHIKINTVHVRDVVRALYFLFKRAPPKSTWNLADKGNTSQGN